MLTDLPPAIAAMLREAWEEYEEGRSEEAALVRQLDKVEAYVQGLEYARSGRLADADTLRSFQIDTEAVGRAPLVVALLGALASLSTTPESDVPAPHTAADSGS
jgi:5'-deoxynucleotidase YfbR-like HD superfamily hydrolase